MMKKILLIVVSFALGLIFFMPKMNLYYTMENILKKEHIMIEEGSIKDRWFDLHITDATLLYDGIASVNVGDISVKPWLVYNTLSATDVAPTKQLQQMLNVQAKEVSLRYSLLDYKHVLIEANGDFGEVEGSADIFAHTIRLNLTPSEAFKNSPLIGQYFQKSEEGLIYESKF
jgi:hypothetical protein